MVCVHAESSNSNNNNENTKRETVNEKTSLISFSSEQSTIEHWIGTVRKIYSLSNQKYSSVKISFSTFVCR